jgi:hypothetical protein
MALLTVTINDPSLQKRSSEVAYAIGAINTVVKELGRGNGNVTSGTILGQSSAGVPNTPLGSWTYTPSASNP